MRGDKLVFATFEVGCLLVAVTFIAACGGSSDPGVTARAQSALRAVEPDLERLSRAVGSADARDSATLAEVQAAGQRASEELSETRRTLRDLADAEDLEPEAAGRVRRQISAVGDLQDLADALSAPSLSTPRIQAASARARLALEDLGSVIDARPIAGDALALNLRKARGRAAKRRGARVADGTRTGQPSAPVGSSGGGSSGTTLSYTQYTGPAFQARVPTGPGWGSPSASEPTRGRLFRTNVRGPGGLFVIIDYTPFEAATFGGSSRSRTVVGQTAFGVAIRYEFQGGRIPECQRSTCYDYIINDRATGRGFAVLAGGGSEAAAIAGTVAESVTPTD